MTWLRVSQLTLSSSRALTLALSLALGPILSGCGDTGGSGSTSTQRGGNYAPQPGSQPTVRPAGTTAAR